MKINGHVYGDHLMRTHCIMIKVNVKLIVKIVMVMMADAQCMIISHGVSKTLY